jgi:hypothetical protein
MRRSRDHSERSSSRDPERSIRRALGVQSLLLDAGQLWQDELADVDEQLERFFCAVLPIDLIQPPFDRIGASLNPIVEHTPSLVPAAPWAGWPAAFVLFTVHNQILTFS